MSARIPTGSPARETVEPSPGIDDVVMTWGIVAITFCLCSGLLVAAQAWPLRWLPGQPAVLLNFLWAAPLAVVMRRRRAAGLIGHAAADYARRTGLALLAALALFLVALPAYEWRLLGRGGLTSTFAEPMLVAVALGLVALAVAGDLAGTWQLLQRQAWEDAKYVGRGPLGVESERGARLNRTEVIRRLWRRWGAGSVILALALVIGERVAGGQNPALAWGVLALLAYVALGLGLMGLAVRVRWSTEWELEQLPVVPEVAVRWTPMVAAVTFGVLLCAALLVVSPLLALAHDVLAWLWAAILVPVLRWLFPLLLRFMQASGTGGNNAGFPHTTGRPMHVRSPGPAQHHTVGAFWIWLAHLWTWLMHSWLYILGVVALATLAWAYWQARHVSGSWWSIVLVMLKELRLVLLALWRPATQLAAQAGGKARRAAARAIARSEAWRRRRLRELGPRQAIIAIYVTALHFAARRGYPRRPAQTPREYAAEVGERVPLARNALAGMTDTFVAVRYAGQSVDSTLVGRMQALATALRKVLRRAARPH